MNEKFALHDIADVAAFVAAVVAQWGRELLPWEREDLAADLFSYCWEISSEYEVRAGGMPFNKWASYKLRNEAVRWTRDGGNGKCGRGRTRWVFADRVHERSLPEFVALDDRKDGTDHSLEMDIGSGRIQDVVGLQRKGDRQGAGSANGQGQGKARRAA